MIVKPVADKWYKLSEVLKKKYGIVLDYVVIIPGHPKPPVLARMAMWVLKRFKASVKTVVVSTADKMPKSAKA